MGISDQLYVKQLHGVNYSRLAQADIDDMLLQLASDAQVNRSSLNLLFVDFVENFNIIAERAGSDEAKTSVIKIQQLIQPYMKAIDSALFPQYKVATLHQLHDELETLIEFETAHGFELLTNKQELIRKQSQQSIWVMALGVLLLLVLGVYLFRRVLKPLSILNKRISRYKDESWIAKKFETPVIHTEITKASNDFIDMAIALEANKVELTATIAELHATNRELTAEVELQQQVQQEMQDLFAKITRFSKQAGMYDVASELIHNLGNSLNSINISVENISSTKALEISGVAVTSLHTQLQEQQEVPKIEFVTKYMRRIANILMVEQDLLAKELSVIQKHLDDMKLLIQRQQSFADLRHDQEVYKLDTMVKEVNQLK